MPEFQRFRPHPWHGLSAGPEPPEQVQAYVEITPFDTAKYEIDKETGYLKIDRIQRSSSLPPALYGFIPRSYCDHRVNALMDGANGGDRDPLDICVLSERSIERSEILVQCRVIGGIPMLDGGLADDKIVAVLKGDPVYGDAMDLTDLPEALVERLVHYFSTYKLVPGEKVNVEVRDPYPKAHALRVVRAALEDYDERYGDG